MPDSPARPAREAANRTRPRGLWVLSPIGVESQRPIRVGSIDCGEVNYASS